MSKVCLRVEADLRSDPPHSSLEKESAERVGALNEFAQDMLQRSAHSID